MGNWNSRGLRGSVLEEEINLTNGLYLRRGAGVIQKVFTPITPIEVNNAEHVITKAYFGQKSTVDYMGVSSGKPLCFDAKETTRTSLPLQNIHSHQIDFMEAFMKQGGVCFLLVKFTQGDVFFLPFDTLKFYWQAAQTGGRKSIPFDSFDITLKVKNELGYPLHYLKYI
ncbi:MAG: Holliday junction resolvase RecU [Clostridiales bacterium]|jgi:recombination protein U|nr:Holliday junction resolvase RecU [Clostridiales bacterium]